MATTNLAGVFLVDVWDLNHTWGHEEWSLWTSRYFFFCFCPNHSPDPSRRLLPLESVAVPVPSRIHLRLWWHQLPHWAALLPGPHLHDWSAACRRARRCGEMPLCRHQGNCRQISTFIIVFRKTCSLPFHRSSFFKEELTRQISFQMAKWCWNNNWSLQWAPTAFNWSEHDEILFERSCSTKPMFRYCIYIYVCVCLFF